MQARIEKCWYVISMIVFLLGCAMVFFCDTVLAQNEAPKISSDFPKTLEIKDGEPKELNLANYVTDDIDKPQDIKWGVEYSHIKVNIQGSIATFTNEAKWIGTENVVLIACDSGGLCVRATLSVTVVRVYTDPVVKLPKSLEIPKNGSRSLYLPYYVTDKYDLPQDITWKAERSSHINVVIEDGRATFTPETNWCGTENVSLIATNSGGRFTKFIMGIRVICVCFPPEIIPGCIKEPIEIPKNGYKELDLTNCVKDDEDKPKDITWKVEESPHIKVKIENSKVTLTPEKGWSGEEYVILIAFDSCGLSDSVILRIVVTDNEPIPPAIIEEKFPEKIVFYEDELYILFLGDKLEGEYKPQEITWKAESSSHISHIQVSILNMNAIFKPETNWNGEERIGLTAIGLNNLTDTIYLDVLVTPVNDAPVILDPMFPQEIVIDKDRPTTLFLGDKVTDVDGNIEDVIWSAKSSSNIRVIIEGNTATFTLKGDWHDLNEWVDLTATDEGGKGKSDSIFRRVVLACTPPEIIRDKFPTAGISTDEDTEVEFSLVGMVKEDKDNRSDEVQWIGQDSVHIHVEINNQIAVFSSKLQNWADTENIILKAKNRCGLLSDPITLTVKFRQINDPPEIIRNAIPPIIIKDGREVKMYLVDKVRDPEDDPQNIEWNAKGNQHIAVIIENKTATFALKELGWYGIEGVELIATDSTGLDSRYNFPVISACSPLILSNLFPIYIEEDNSETVELCKLVKDEDTKVEEITWVVQNSPHIQLVVSGCYATFKPKLKNWHGVEKIIITAIDGEGLSNTAEIAITFIPIPEPPVILANKFPPLVSREGKPIRVELYDKVEDDDDRPDQIIWGSDGGPNIQVDIVNNKEVVFYPREAGWHGTEDILLTATDTEGKPDTASFSIAFPSRPPKILSAKFPKPVVFVSSQSYTISLLDAVEDENPETVTWETLDSTHVHLDVSDAGLTFTAKAPFDGEEYVTVIAKDEEGQTDSPVVLPVKVVRDLLIDMPKWVLWQDQVYLPLTTADGRKIEWDFSSTSHVIPHESDGFLIIEIEPPNWYGVVKIGWVVTDENGLSVSGYFTAVVMPSSLRFDENSGGCLEAIAPYLLDEKSVPYNLRWIAEDGGSTHIEVTISGRTVCFKPRAEIGRNWIGTERIHFRVVDEVRGITGVCYIDITFSPTPQPPQIDDEKIGTIPVTFITGEEFTFPIRLSELVTDADTPSDKIYWTSKGSQHVEVSFDDNSAIFRVREEYEGWIGNESLVLVAQDDTKPEPLSDYSMPILVKVTNIDDPIPIVPCWKFWQNTMSGWDLTEFVSNKERVNQIKWSFGPGENIHPEVSDNVVKFQLSNPNFYGSEEIHYTVNSKIDDKQFASGIVTVIVIPSNWRSNEPLSLAQTVVCNGARRTLLWKREEGCAMSFKENTVSFITNQDCTVKIRATDNTGNSDVAIISVAAVNSALSIMTNKFLEEKGFSTDKDILSLKLVDTIINKPALFRNFPNPFNSETWIPYQLAQDSDVEICIYDSMGKLVRTINLGHQKAGNYVSQSKAAYWNGYSNSGETVGSGIYFYVIKSGNFYACQKMTIIR